MNKKKRGRPKFQGCNDDCFNCPYPDCKKPIKQIKNEDNFRLFKAEGESQAKMYTLSLGGYGGARPNINKKYLRSTLW